MASAHHHIVLSNPFARPDDVDDGDDSSVDSSAPHTPTNGHNSSGLRAQLTHLLPRHAFFHVNIHIHQITNIPLVSGEFAIKWKFKNAHGVPGTKAGTGLLGGFKARRKARREEKRREEYSDMTELGARGEAASTRTNSIDGHASMWSGVSTTTSSSSSSASSKAPKSTNTTTTSSSTSSAPALPASVSPATTPGHGQTSFLRLKDHGVAWEYTLSLLVRMDVDRDPQSMLLPCPVKLTVLQRDPTRPEAKAVPFGIVMLDLAQYASKGEVGRRYLLRESKTNATLKLTTHLTHIPTTHASSVPPSATSSTMTGTSTASASAPSTPHTTSTMTNTFTAPPLPKGEILNGISSILQGTSLVGAGGEGDVYRVRPRGLDLYGPYYDQEELEFDLLGGRAAPKEKAKGKGKGTKGKEKEIEKEKEPPPAPVRTRERSATQSFDPSRLPLAYGAKTTEALIEALFNPVETRHREKESPFTVYVPDPTPPREGMPKRPGATPIQNPDTPTSFIDTSPPTSFINTSPRSRAAMPGQQKGTSPSVSFAATSPRSGMGSGAGQGGRSVSSSPYTSPLLPPSMTSKSASSSPYFAPPHPSTSPTPSIPASSPSPSTTPMPPTLLPALSPSSTVTPVARTATMQSAKSAKSTKSPRKRQQPQRPGSAGIGAGLGIMGLGMGMGVGMGVGIGVSGGRTTAEPEEREKEKEGSTGVKAWLKRAAKGPSRPGTPSTSTAVGVAS
ncbi:hypothetical protein DXG01_007234 [Tephrocybe rancida]|nr:hypothetical protein DXG01_007234 [Tephrocybe rancida]